MKHRVILCHSNFLNAMKIAAAPSESPHALLRSRERLVVRVTPGALLEAGGPWLLVLLVGLVLIAALLVLVQGREVDDLRAARLSVTLSELSERLEQDLALGFDLAENSRAQTLIEDLINRDRGLEAIEIFDVNKISLFNTDRGSIGEQVPAAWAQAVTGLDRSRTWQVSGTHEAVSGIAIYGPFGKPAGYVAVTIARASLPDLGRFIGHVLFAALLLCLIFPIAAWWSMRGDRPARNEQLAATGVDRLLQAQVRLQMASTALRDTGSSSLP